MKMQFHMQSHVINIVNVVRIQFRMVISSGSFRLLRTLKSDVIEKGAVHTQYAIACP